MFASPIRELEQLRKPNPRTAEGREITAESPIQLDAKDQLFDILVTVKQGTASKAVLGFGENQVTYDFAAQKLDEMPLKLKGGRVTFRVLVDRPMYEVAAAEAPASRPPPAATWASRWARSIVFVLVLFVLLIYPSTAIFVFAMAYLIWGIIENLMLFIRKRRQKREEQQSGTGVQP